MNNLKKFFHLLWNLAGVLTIFLYLFLILSLFLSGTFEAGGLIWLVMFYLVMPIAVVHIFIFYLMRANNYIPTKFENIINRTVVFLIVSSVLLVIFDYQTEFFYNIGKNKIRLK